MDNRLYFVLGDLFANIFVGALVGFVCWLMVSTGWNMWLAMYVLMAVGMFIALVLWMPASIFLGAMELMVPVMLSGMISGMVLGMWCAMAEISSMAATQIGAICGLICIVFVWIFNNTLRGVSTQQGQA